MHLVDIFKMFDLKCCILWEDLQIDNNLACGIAYYCVDQPNKRSGILSAWACCEISQVYHFPAHQLLRKHCSCILLFKPNYKDSVSNSLILALISIIIVASTLLIDIDPNISLNLTIFTRSVLVTWS